MRKRFTLECLPIALILPGFCRLDSNHQKEQSVTFLPSSRRPAALRSGSQTNLNLGLPGRFSPTAPRIWRKGDGFREELLARGKVAPPTSPLGLPSCGGARAAAPKSLPRPQRGRAARSTSGAAPATVRGAGRLRGPPGGDHPRRSGPAFRAPAGRGEAPAMPRGRQGAPKVEPAPQGRSPPLSRPLAALPQPPGISRDAERAQASSTGRGRWHRGASLLGPQALASCPPPPKRFRVSPASRSARGAKPGRGHRPAETGAPLRCEEAAARSASPLAGSTCAKVDRARGKVDLARPPPRAPR